MSKFINPGTTDFAFPTGNGDTVLIPVQDDPPSLCAANSIAHSLKTQLADGAITSYTYDGSTPFNPPAGNTELIVDAAGASLSLTSNISNVLINTDSFVTLTSGAGNTSLNIVSGLGGLDLIANDGTGTVLAAGGDNSINVLVGGNHEIVTGGGDDSIEVDHGDNLVSAGAGTNAITLGDGNNYVMSTGQDAVFATPGLTTGGTDTINASLNSNAVQIRGGHNNIEFINGGGVSKLVARPAPTPCSEASAAATSMAAPPATTCWSAAPARSP
jgi:hypothetical protein